MFVGSVQQEEDFEEDEGIYDELNLSDEEDMYQIGGDDHQSSHDSVSVADEPAPPEGVGCCICAITWVRSRFGWQHRVYRKIQVMVLE